MTPGHSQRTRAESVARLQRALLIAVHEPSLALFGRAMGEGIRHYPPRRLPLQRVVTDRGRGLQRAVDIAGLEETRALLLLVIDPDTGQAIGLQLDLHLQRVGGCFAAGLLLLRRHPRQDAEQVLDVMSGFMGDDIGGGEFAGIARTAMKAGLDLAEKSGVEEYLPFRRAIERPHRRLRHAAAPAVGDVSEQHDFRTRVGRARGLEDLAPAIVDLTEDTGDHVAHLVGWYAALGRRRAAVALIARRLAAAVEDLRTTDQDTRIDAEGVGDQAEHDDGADAEPTAADGQTEAAAPAHSATAVVAAILDVGAAAEIIVLHGGGFLIPSLPAALRHW